MSVKTIILDWAGTTVDFGCMAPVLAFQKAFANKGIQLNNQEIRKPMGLLKVEHIRQLLALDRVKQEWLEQYGSPSDENDVDSIYQDFEHYLFADLAENSHLKPDTKKAVDQLQAAGFKIGSTTGYTNEMMKVVAETAKIEGYAPDHLVTPDDVNSLGRPYPFMIFENMRFFKNREMSEVIKVGDTISDIREGKNAGVFSIAVTEGSSVMGLSMEEYQALLPEEKQELNQQAANTFYQEGADLCVHNLLELAELLQEKASIYELANRKNFGSS
ncbi:phosphonoacetaldehyde hydrolase [Enterococcus florum]|uniref:Phosphonoacetaldehyde hydrolase n=1 Tax=Enterococcus florum TaxID=2480627 RepID=A0A4P5P4K0_9ENTE|nr:phosphonoacetaldehyde hydrolase [Enterococcus florum]GCF92737.1 phosphonoacetaldehyde hydrolase [Enterococcus florum]